MEFRRWSKRAIKYLRPIGTVLGSLNLVMVLIEKGR